jgi:hypothetical protein
MSEKTIYSAYLTQDLRDVCLPEYVDGPDLASMKDGFWVNGDSEFTTGSDCTIWIPSTQILYILKVG